MTSLDSTNSLASPPRLKMTGIGKRFGGVVALEGVDLAADAGKVLALCGENGAGKSTLMKILCGAIVDYDGTIEIDGKRVKFAGPRDSERAGVAIIHQELNLVPDLTVAGNMFLGREKTIGGFLLNDRSMERSAAEMLDRLGAGFSPRAKVRDLRIGDQQLVEIAKAISLDADIVIMDEPTSALAESETARLFRIVEKLKSDGRAVIYISHKMDEVFHLADRIAVLRDGRHVKTGDRDAMAPTDVIQLMVGRELGRFDFSPSKPGEELLRVENLSLPHVDRPDRMQLDAVNLTIRAGEAVGVAGLLGAGRTELLECLFGASHRKPSGKIYVRGALVKLPNPRAAIERGIAMVTEDRKNLGIFDQWSVGSNISVCSLDDLSFGPFVRLIKERRATADSVRRLGIKTDGTGASILSLSGGNQQKCVIARWLRTDPKVLLLDEPTRGIDVGAKAEIYRLIRTLCDQGIGVLMTSSELPELLAVADRIIVLCEGRITGEMPRAEATEAKIIQAATQFRTRAPANSGKEMTRASATP